MSSLLLIVGLPGAGKTSYAKKFIEANPTWMLWDDMGLGEAPHTILMLAAALKSHRSCVVTDPTLCDPIVRKECESFLSNYASIRWIFFTNDPEQCCVNAKRRGNLEQLKSYIESLSTVYRIPANATVLYVYGTLFDKSLNIHSNAIVIDLTLWDKIKIVLKRFIHEED